MHPQETIRLHAHVHVYTYMYQLAYILLELIPEILHFSLESLVLLLGNHQLLLKPFSLLLVHSLQEDEPTVKGLHLAFFFFKEGGGGGGKVSFLVYQGSQTHVKERGANAALNSAYPLLKSNIFFTLCYAARR